LVDACEACSIAWAVLVGEQIFLVPTKVLIVTVVIRLIERRTISRQGGVVLFQFVGASLQSSVRLPFRLGHRSLPVGRSMSHVATAPAHAAGCLNGSFGDAGVCA
jgi:hypothetical protein